MTRSSAGKDAIRLANTLSTCSGGIAAIDTSRPVFGGAGVVRVSGIEFAVAIRIRESQPIEECL